jgi:hypothetical protein
LWSSYLKTNEIVKESCLFFNVLGI